MDGQAQRHEEVSVQEIKLEKDGGQEIPTRGKAQHKEKDFGHKGKFLQAMKKEISYEIFFPNPLGNLLP